MIRKRIRTAFSAAKLPVDKEKCIKFPSLSRISPRACRLELGFTALYLSIISVLQTNLSGSNLIRDNELMSLATRF